MFHRTVAKILNSWLQRAIIFLRKRFPVALVLKDFKVWNWPKWYLHFYPKMRQELHKPGFSVFVVVKKWFLEQVLYSTCLLDASDVLTVCDFTQIAGCYWELLLERGGEILWKRKRMFYHARHAVTWPPTPAQFVSAAIWFYLLPTQSMSNRPGRRTLWTSFVLGKTSLLVGTLMCIKLTLF